LNSFPRDHRLVNKAQFQSVFDESTKASQRYLLALYKPNSAVQARIGIIVGKRVANLSVERNRIRRVIRESFRANQEKLKGLDIIVIARQQSDSLDKVQLREGIDKLWQRLITQYHKVSL
jgi:ribonuclease P protein component